VRRPSAVHEDEERSLDYDPRPSEYDGKIRNARVSARDDSVNPKRGQKKVADRMPAVHEDEERSFGFAQDDDPRRIVRCRTKPAAAPFPPRRAQDSRYNAEIQ
jgi:hypothetical protein